MIKLLLAVLMAFFTSALCVLADTWTDPDTGYVWAYRIVGDGAEVYNGGNVAVSPSPAGALSIPSSLDGKPVASIGAGAFADCSDITSVTIPGSVKCVGFEAFRGCLSLTNAIMDADAEIYVPGLRQIKRNQFFDTTTLPSDETEGDIVSGAIAAYQKAMSAPWEFSDPLTGEVFAWNEHDTTFAYFGQIYLEAGKTYVFGSVFDDAVRITVDRKTVLNVESYTVAIKTGTFSCLETGWHDIEIRLGDSSGEKGPIGAGGWSWEFGLGYREDGEMSTSQGDWKALLDQGDGSLLRYKRKNERTIAARAFYGCSALQEIIIPESVSLIGDQAFSGCSALLDVDIPDSVVEIGFGAFEDCDSLTNVTMESAADCWVPGLGQVKFNRFFDTESQPSAAGEYTVVSGAIAAYSRVGGAPWEFSDSMSGKTFAWNERNSTFAYFGQMYMEAGKTYGK